MRFLLCALAAFLLAPQSSASDADQALAQAEAAWARRAENHSGAQADPGPIDEAIRAFEAALSEDPQDLGAKARLLKALWFKGEHVALEPDSRLSVFQDARNIAQDAIDTLTPSPSGGRDRAAPQEIATHLRNTPHAAEIYFWGAAHWGLWGRHRGKIASARQGVAGKIRDYAEVVIALDENMEGAGGRRILGRLHTEAPKLPFITGWIDRNEAVRQLERAIELAPDDLLNRLYYLEALIEFDKARRPQAIQELRELVEIEPNAATVVEDLKILAEARELLERVDR
jgi:tetratricopeptide (TPR) repeat protein